MAAIAGGVAAGVVLLAVVVLVVVRRRRSQVNAVDVERGTFRGGSEKGRRETALFANPTYEPAGEAAAHA